jgi:hypothetical protein
MTQSSQHDIDTLARLAIACKGWRWLPGMLAAEQAVPGMALSTRPMRVDDYWHEVGVWLPDLSDPATLGCLLALVREAWGDDTVYASNLKGYDGYDWVCIVDTSTLTPGKVYPHTRHGVTYFCGLTEAEVLVAALEAAP